MVVHQLALALVLRDIRNIPGFRLGGLHIRSYHQVATHLLVVALALVRRVVQNILGYRLGGLHIRSYHQVATHP